LTPERTSPRFSTSLDKEADRLGVTRQSIIKIWIAERLKEKTA
jgi:hypothetical protein